MNITQAIQHIKANQLDYHEIDGLIVFVHADGSIWYAPTNEILKCNCDMGLFHTVPGAIKSCDTIDDVISSGF
jgi:hypothetical protein